MRFCNFLCFLIVQVLMQLHEVVHQPKEIHQFLVRLRLKRQASFGFSQQRLPVASVRMAFKPKGQMAHWGMPIKKPTAARPSAFNLNQSNRITLVEFLTMIRQV